MNGLAVKTSVVVAWLFNDEDKLRAGRLLDRRVD